MRFSFYYKSLKSTYLKDIDSGGIIEFDGEIISKIDSDSIYFKNENKKTIEEAFLLDERNDCKTMSLVIVTNTNCNLRCSYCYEGNKDNNTQIMESYEAIYNFILANIKYNNIKKLDVEFTGGEPLLNKELIVNLVKTLNENLLLTDINYTLITNGVLLDNDIIQFLSENKFSVQISLDGFKNDHNLERHGENIYNSYDVIINKMKKILTDELNIDLILRINVTNKNKDNLYLLVDDLVKKFSAK